MLQHATLSTNKKQQKYTKTKPTTAKCQVVNICHTHIKTSTCSTQVILNSENLPLSRLLGSGWYLSSSLILDAIFNL